MICLLNSVDNSKQTCILMLINTSYELGHISMYSTLAMKDSTVLIKLCTKQ